MVKKLAEKHLTAEEVQAMIALWAQRQDAASTGPTIADVAEALEISLAEAEALALEISISPPTPSSREATQRAIRLKEPVSAGIFAGRLALASVALTGFFCASLNTLLS